MWFGRIIDSDIEINATLATIMASIEHTLKNYIYIWVLYYSLMDFACLAEALKELMVLIIRWLDEVAVTLRNYFFQTYIQDHTGEIGDTGEIDENRWHR